MPLKFNKYQIQIFYFIITFISNENIIGNSQHEEIINIYRNYYYQKVNKNVKISVKRRMKLETSTQRSKNSHWRE